jgi:CheY-like chemotaxis protein
VEDNQDAAETIVMCLETYGYEVTHVGTCAEAVRKARDGGFDIVLTDLGLPDGSGIDVGRALSKSLPVVALSGYGATPDLQRSAMAGFSGHLVKPAEPQAIHAALAEGAGRARRTHHLIGGPHLVAWPSARQGEAQQVAPAQFLLGVGQVQHFAHGGQRLQAGAERRFQRRQRDRLFTARGAGGFERFLQVAHHAVQEELGGFGHQQVAVHLLLRLG